MEQNEGLVVFGFFVDFSEFEYLEMEYIGQEKEKISTISTKKKKKKS